jgi:hypothetical protein
LSSTAEKDWQSSRHTIRVIAAQLHEVTASTSRLNQQQVTTIHHPPVKVEGLAFPLSCSASMRNPHFTKQPCLGRISPQVCRSIRTFREAGRSETAGGR